MQSLHYKNTSLYTLKRYVILFICFVFSFNRIALSKYDNNPICFDALVGVNYPDDITLPSEGQTWCTAARAFLGAAAASAVMAGAGAIAAAIFMATQKGIESEFATSSQMCDYEIHPMPYTDGQISRILKQSGKSGNIRQVVDYYDKVCFRYDGTNHWIKNDQCIKSGGKTFCGIAPAWSDQMICVYLVSTCPCIGSVGRGSLQDAEYEKDGDDTYKMDSVGNPVISDYGDFKKYFAKHCNMITSVNAMPLKPDAYKGVIDELCNSWSGYSKIGFPLTSGVVQCLQGTMQNIFQKPIGLAQDSNTGAFTMNAAAQVIYDEMNSDMKKVSELLDESRKLLSDINDRPLYKSTKFSHLTNKINSLKTGGGFKSRYSADYTMDKTQIVLNLNDDTKNISILSKQIGDLQTTISSINKRIDNFMESIQSSGKKLGQTMFETVQGPFKLVAFFIIILFITLTGAQIILGSFEMTMTNILKTTVKLGIIYYFALGDAWKQYFYRMIFDASIGVSEIIFESTMGHSSTIGKCNFIGNNYHEDPSKTCIFPNQKNGGSKKPQFLKKDLETGNPIHICIKGPFIKRPVYERIYVPFVYDDISPSGLYTEKVLQVYCVSDTGVKKTATLINDDVTGKPKRWVCKDSKYSLEEGYRIKELEKIGLDIGHIDPSLGKNDVLSTALFSRNSDGVKFDLFPPRSSSVTKVKEKIIRIKTIQALEYARSNINKKYRRYPIVKKFGIARDYSFVGLFDMVDCKLLDYFRYNAIDGFDLLPGTDALGIIFGGIMALLLMIAMICMGIFIAALVGRATQAYLVAIIAITILIYFTPIIMPLGLFKATESLYKDWKNKLISYAFFPPILFMSVAVAFVTIDFSMYGPETTFKEKSMFKSNGSVDGRHCWDSSWWSAPTACLMAKLKYHPNTVSFLGISFKAGTDPKLSLATIFASFKTMLIILMMSSVVMQCETVFAKLMNLNADISLAGSIFNDPSQLGKMVQKGVTVAKDAAVKIGTSAKKGYQSGKANAAKKKDDESSSVPRKK